MFTKSKILPKKIISSLVMVLFAFSTVATPGAFAQALPSFLNMPASGTMLTSTAAFNPTVIMGINIRPEDSLKFDFIIDKGESNLEGEAFNAEANRLIKYFLAALTTPQEQMWVNLSPYESGRIIPEVFGRTEMGRDMLAQDYILKQLSASLLSPEEALGEEFWRRFQTKAKEQFGSSEIPLSVFNKIWIVPATASIYEHSKGAYIVASHLNVMLEQDYLALDINRDSTEHGLGSITDSDLNQITGTAADIIREVLLPEIEREVNQGRLFAPLRQIFHSMLLAKWYKDNLKASLLGQVYADQSKTDGVNTDPAANQQIYNAYLKAFETGAYNYVKEEYDPASQTIIPKKYFSGGATLEKTEIKKASPAMMSGVKKSRPDADSLAVVQAGVKRADAAMSVAKIATSTPGRYYDGGGKFDALSATEKKHLSNILKTMADVNPEVAWVEYMRRARSSNAGEVFSLTNQRDIFVDAFRELQASDSAMNSVVERPALTDENDAGLVVSNTTDQALLAFQLPDEITAKLNRIKESDEYGKIFRNDPEKGLISAVLESSSQELPRNLMRLIDHLQDMYYQNSQPGPTDNKTFEQLGRVAQLASNLIIYAFETMVGGINEVIDNPSLTAGDVRNQFASQAKTNDDRVTYQGWTLSLREYLRTIRMLNRDLGAFFIKNMTVSVMANLSDAYLSKENRLSDQLEFMSKFLDRSGVATMDNSSVPDETQIGTDDISFYKENFINGQFALLLLNQKLIDTAVGIIVDEVLRLSAKTDVQDHVLKALKDFLAPAVGQAINNPGSKQVARGSVSGDSRTVNVEIDFNSTSMNLEWQIVIEDDAPDQAMQAQTSTQTPTGGIDFNPDAVAMKVFNDGQGFTVIPPSFAEIEQFMNNSGFVPVIFNVTPVTSLPLLLGLDDDEFDTEVAISRL